MKNNIELEQSAGKAFSRRIFAGIIDLILWITLFVIAGTLFGETTTTMHGSTSSTNVSLTGMPFVIFIVISLAYFVILEWRLGATVGKLLLGIRVVGDNGEAITLKQSIQRNILRVVDAFPYLIPYVAGLVSVASDDCKRRLGDKIAKTVVIKK